MSANHSRATAKHILGTLLWPFPTKLVSRLAIGKGQGLVLMFHYIGAPVLAGVGSDLFLPAEEFAKILDFVSSRLCPLDPEQFLLRLRNGTLPQDATLLTFDDCTQRTVDQALPELAARQLKACFFANPGLIDAGRTVPCLALMSVCAQCPPGQYELSWPTSLRLEIGDAQSRAAAYRLLWPSLIACPSRQHPDVLASLRESLGMNALKAQDALPEDVRLASWPSLERLHKAGMLVANHTLFHSTVQADGLAQFTADVAQSYDALEARFPAGCRVFCYPYGRTVDAIAETAALLRTLRTDYAFVTQGGIARADRSGLLNLRREGAVYSAGSTKLAPLLAVLRQNGHLHAT